MALAEGMACTSNGVHNRLAETASSVLLHHPAQQKIQDALRHQHLGGAPPHQEKISAGHARCHQLHFITSSDPRVSGGEPSRQRWRPFLEWPHNGNWHLGVTGTNLYLNCPGRRPLPVAALGWGGHKVMESSRKWTFEFQEATSSTTKEVQDRLGFGKLPGELEDRGADGRQKKELVEATFKYQKAMEFGQSPFKQVLMMAFMMYMAGSQINLFSIGIVVSGVWQPISALRSLDKSFEPFRDPRNSFLLPKLMFVLLQLAGLGVCIWKLNALGLLPTHSSDWVSSLSPLPEIEFAGGGVPFD